jgi:hypothetical protein
MTDGQIAYRAIDAACQFNTKLTRNGYGSDSIELLNELIEEMAAIVEAFPDLDVAGVIEFYEIHAADDGRLDLETVGYARAMFEGWNEVVS